MLATASTSRAIVSRGHGQVPNASMDAQSMSTTITFRSDGAGLRSPLVAGGNGPLCCRRAKLGESAAIGHSPREVFFGGTVLFPAELPAIDCRPTADVLIWKTVNTY
jgi:hypothetical protein